MQYCTVLQYFDFGIVGADMSRKVFSKIVCVLKVCVSERSGNMADINRT